jgi:hypothetical protein
VGTGGTRETQRPAPMRPRRTNKKWSLALGGMVVAFAVLAGYDLVFGGGLSAGSSASPSASPKAAAHRGTVRRTAPPATSPAASAVPLPHVSLPGPSPTASPARPLTVASVAAFGPDGTSDGDNPESVSNVVDGAGSWHSSWYTTPEFGNLQSGTGILLDMGQPVTVNSVALELGDAVGTDVQVRAGNTAVLDDMSTAASASDVGGTVHLPLSAPAHARYVLIWFTKLPPNSDGQYQVTVYNATVNGRP